MSFHPLQLVTRFLNFGRKWLFLLTERRRKVLSGATMIANELAFNGEAVGQYEKGGRAMSDLREEIVLDAWGRFGWEAHAYSKAGHKELWESVAAAYDELRRTQKRGASPPAAAHLYHLAETLRNARY